MKYTLRQGLGALIFDVPLYIYYLCHKPIDGNPAWLLVRNRNEKLDTSKNPFGVHCKWLWTSDLYLPKIFPYFGKRLFSKTLEQYQFIFKGQNASINDRKDVSFIIGHRGSARIGLLLKTLESIAAQDNCSVECIVVEQDHSPSIQEQLPSWVTYVFTPVNIPGMAYSRSWAFNVGANNANSECLIFHDNDLLIPTNYASETLALFKRGYDFINLKRFIFYLSQTSSAELLSHGKLEDTLVVDSIMQNAEGGGSIGASKMAFDDIGGFDERFIGWGGEDTEFWERALTKHVWLYGYLPIIHLWHGAQAEKIDIEASDTKALYNELSKQSPKSRISALNIRARGRQCEDA